MKNKRINIFLVLIVMVIIVFMSSILVFSQEKVSLKYLWETGVVRGDIALGDYSMPVICGEFLYIEQHGRVNDENDVPYGELEIYNMKTGELLKRTEYLGVFNRIGPVSNGKEVVYFNEVNNSLTKYEGITSVWEKKFDEGIWDVVMDEKNIYIPTNKRLIKMDFNGDIVDSIFDNKVGGSILYDDQYIYTYYSRDTLIKVDKESFKIIYQKNVETSSVEIDIQNNKYLFGNAGDIINKKTGELTNYTKTESYDTPLMYFEAGDNYVVYEKNNKLIAKDSKFNILWEKEISREFYSIEPVIYNNLLYIYLDRLEIIDLKTGETIWQDKKRNEYIDFVSQINVTDKYVTVYISRGDSVIRIYEKQNQ